MTYPDGSATLIGVNTIPAIVYIDQKKCAKCLQLSGLPPVHDLLKNVTPASCGKIQSLVKLL